MTERVQKLIAQAGIASRRDAEALIVQGRVTVNGKRVQLGDQADAAQDDIRIDGERLRPAAQKVYFMLNKPMQVVTTVKAQEQEHRRTVRELIKFEGHLYPVGRLDADSEGLILLTNDGELAERLSHPRYHHTKVYEVTVYGFIPDERLDEWRRGVTLDDGPTRPVEIKVLARDKHHSVLQITMTEGRKRQIRRIARLMGHPVKSLLRTHLATLALGTLKTGEWRPLTEAEIAALVTSAASSNNPMKLRPARSARRGEPHRREAHREEHARQSDHASHGARRPGDRPRRPAAEGRHEARPQHEGRPQREDRPPREGRPQREERRETPREDRREPRRETRQDDRPPRENRPYQGERPRRGEGARPSSGRPPARSGDRSGDRPHRPAGGDRPPQRREPRPDSRPEDYRPQGEERPAARAERPQSEDRPPRTGGSRPNRNRPGNRPPKSQGGAGRPGGGRAGRSPVKRPRAPGGDNSAGGSGGGKLRPGPAARRPNQGRRSPRRRDGDR